MPASFKELLASTPLNGSNATLIESLYEDFLADPDSVPDTWRRYFADFGPADNGARRHSQVVAEIRDGANGTNGHVGSRRTVRRAAAGRSAPNEKQAAVSRLIQVYSLRGHQIADIDPLGLLERPLPAVLKPDFLGLNEADLDTEFFTGGLAGTGDARMKLRDILALLRRIYCGKIGAEFAHISRSRERLWLREKFEAGSVNAFLSVDEKRWVLDQLSRAEGLERYLHTRFVGQKRFSLEGGDGLIPLLNDLIERGGRAGIHEVVVGMAHRGRINVLVNVMGKSPEDLFSEFEGKNYDPETVRGSGDVKYHMGFSADVSTEGCNVHVALAFNPSHLEIVDPVVEGSVRARQERRGDKERGEILPVLIHGDAAFAGQGVVTETFQMSQARGFTTGGTIHIVINNQIGFTTSDPLDARSTPYCSDVAKMIEAPVFHVNGDDPEAALFVTRLALEYRQKFRKDVVIDFVCYRRLGHNEADEPAATQPVMYKKIRAKKTPRQTYAERLIAEGVVDQATVDELVDAYRNRLDHGAPVRENLLGMIGNEFTVDWAPFAGQDYSKTVPTALDAATAERLASSITTVPPGFALHARVKKIMDDRLAMAAGKLPMDWGFAETMAYASLLDQGFRVRLTGQDAERGTFFHRHAVLHDQHNNAEHLPLRSVAKEATDFTITDSLLSEEAVMAFEYGYTTTDPMSLVVWEAQFGDFANGAQVVIDQFISSGEAKWGRLCGLTLFLPHGYEGQGPEHSSARLERFLQLCAEYNMQVCVPSTPAQMFHMLRRQMVRDFRKPLIVMTPKSLLRHKLSVSPYSDLIEGRFHRLIGEVDELTTQSVTRVVFCSGKIYYDLLEERRERKIDDVAIIRLEQLYPFPTEAYADTISRYGQADDIVWCQEEPQNQGAWYQIRHRLQIPLEPRHTLYYAGRPGAAAPAAGMAKIHTEQQKALVQAALGIPG
ncbi:MAG: 2-oxoglutarate dehydrogenase E1 component [Pseudomonadota bacterium]